MRRRIWTGVDWAAWPEREKKKVGGSEKREIKKREGWRATHERRKKKKKARESETPRLISP